MTPPYTAADVETVACQLAIHPVLALLRLQEDGAPEALGMIRDCAGKILDALAERGQGLAPVIAHEWSIRYPGGTVNRVGTFTEAGARQRADELCAEVVYRAVGPWIAAGEPA